MKMQITSSDLKSALRRVAAHSRSKRDELCAADAQLGDGDLGITVSEGFDACATLHLPEDVGKAFYEMAKTFQSVSSSSFGTLIATGLMAAAKETKGRTSLDSSEIAGLLSLARDAMLARGRSSLGEKTVLDGIDAQAKALQEGSSAALDTAIAAARDTVETFRNRQNQAGRARIFAEKSKGLPDPGQLALVVMTEGLR
jgi:phosphoenolpyruvate---glycerone phosphotransferase subunit DhaL